MKKMRENIKAALLKVAFKAEYLTEKIYFDMRYFGIKYYIKKLHKKIRLKMIFEPMFFWAKGRIAEKVKKKIEESKKDDDENPH